MDEVTTLGQAYDAGWRLTVRCNRRREGLTSVRPCITPFGSYAVDLKTMLWTHGRDCPLMWLDGRLKCPHCGTRHVFLLWSWPGNIASALAQ